MDLIVGGYLLWYARNRERRNREPVAAVGVLLLLSRLPDVRELPGRAPPSRGAFIVALVVVGLLTAALAALFSSPDEPQLTLTSWSRSAPADFVATAATELDGTSASARYGAPYNHTPGTGQKIGPVALRSGSRQR